ncbi:MAG: radical SAM protein [Bryobacteraceae bacterium]
MSLFRILQNSIFGKPQTISQGMPPAVPRLAGDTTPALVCKPIFEQLCVLANGDVVCSCADPTGMRVYGNILKDRIADIYNGPKYQEVRRWQLESKPDSWCPVIANPCAGRVTRVTAAETVDRCTVKYLQLEPLTYCNLRCPSCPVTTHFPLDEFAHREDQMLPLEAMLDLIDQLPDLETLLFYNFGEAFLHRDAITFLREIRKRRPDIYIASSTNGLVLTSAQIDAIANEALLNKMVFSIDGASEETYRQYRVGGTFEKAFRNMTAFLEAAGRAGTRPRIETYWQYILFEWNDHDEEIERAQAMARSAGVPLLWVLTHTEGASRRYLPDSKEYEELSTGPGSVQFLTCEVQLSQFWQNSGIADGRYLAKISAGDFAGRSAPGATFEIPVTVENISPEAWFDGNPQGGHLGVMLRTSAGRKIRELPGAPLPASVAQPGSKATVPLNLTLPAEQGRYQVLFDVVESGVCWYFERGSQPLILDVQVQ